MNLLQSATGIRLTFEEKKGYAIQGKNKMSMLELSSFLYDFNLLHDCLALTTLPDYKDYYFAQYFWYRKGRPLHKEHQLYVNKINHNSQLELEVIIPIAAAALGMPWVILQAIEKIQNWKLNREKLQLEINNQQLEKEKRETEQTKQLLELDTLLRQREATRVFDIIMKRIEQSQLIAIDIEIFFLDIDDNETQEKE